MINGKIYKVIFNLYKFTKTCIQSNNRLSEMFECNVGVRQGENLSPLLFSLYLNDLKKELSDKFQGLPFLDNIASDMTGTKWNTMSSFLLLYADDTAILAESQEEMQLALDALAAYCDKNSLTVNASKTKVMVFSKGKIRKTPNLTFGHNNLELVFEYTYLGVVFSHNGKFGKHVTKRIDKVHNSMYGLLRSIRQLGLPSDLSCHLFDSMVSPIMTYGCEVWGNQNIDSLETVHMKFCKFVLGVNKSTTNAMVYGELGRHPLQVEITLGILCFWARIVTNECQKLSVMIYKFLYNLYITGRYKSQWLDFIKTQLDHLGLSYMWCYQMIVDYDRFKGIVKLRLLDQYKQGWRTRLEESTKCIFYSKIKNNLSFESYLTHLPKPLCRKMTLFRLSNHRLPVEFLRYSGVKREERICNKCNECKIGDEEHYLLYCKYFNQQRQLYLGDVRALEILFNDNKNTIQYNLANFVSYIMNEFK